MRPAFLAFLCVRGTVPPDIGEKRRFPAYNELTVFSVGPFFDRMIKGTQKIHFFLEEKQVTNPVAYGIIGKYDGADQQPYRKAVSE